MDAKSAQVASQPLKYQTWFLKVSIHCEGCRRKVKKVLRNIDGVFTSTIDPQQQKVTVTGIVGVETLIRKLLKAGKQAEVWPESLTAGKGKTSGKAKKRNERRDQESAKNHSAPNAESNLCSAKSRGIENAENSGNGEKSKKSSNSKTGGNSPDNSPADATAPEKDNRDGEGEGGSVKKKKKKGQSQSGGSGSNGLSSGSGSSSTSAPAHTGSQLQSSTGQVVGQMNLSPTRQQSYLYPETYYYPPLVYLATYNRMCPIGKMGGPSHYVSPFPYMHAGLDHDPYHFQSPPLVPFEIFSDENANGCTIM